MRLLIGWILRSILTCAVVALVIAWLISDSSIDYLTAYLWSFGLTSLGSIVYWVADYLIDYDDWQREVKS